MDARPNNISPGPKLRNLFPQLRHQLSWCTWRGTIWGCLKHIHFLPQTLCSNPYIVSKVPTLERWKRGGNSKTACKPKEMSYSTRLSFCHKHPCLLSSVANVTGCFLVLNGGKTRWHHLDPSFGIPFSQLRHQISWWWIGIDDDLGKPRAEQEHDHAPRHDGMMGWWVFVYS